MTRESQVSSLKLLHVISGVGQIDCGGGVLPACAQAVLTDRSMYCTAATKTSLLFL